MKKILLIIAIISLFSFNNLNAAVLWSQNFTTGTTGFYTFSPNFTRNAGNAYTCVAANFVIYTNTSNAYFVTNSFTVPSGKGIRFSFDSKRNNALGGVINVYYLVTGACSFSTSDVKNNGWVLWGTITPNQSALAPGGCTNNILSLNSVISGGQVIAIALHCPTATGTNRITIDNLVISDDGPTTAIPNISGATVDMTNFNYASGFNNPKWYGPVTSGDHNSASTTMVPYRSYRGATDARTYLWNSGGAAGKVGHTGTAGDYYVAFHNTGFEFCGSSITPQIITKEYNTSGCANPQVSFAFKSRYPTSGNLGYTNDEDYIINSPKVYVSKDSGYTWVEKTVNYYFADDNWRHATVDIPSHSNVKIRITRGSAIAFSYIDDLKVSCRDCRIASLSGGTISGPGTTLEPNTNYNFSITATTYATYYKWIVRNIASPTTIHYGTTAGVVPAIVAGQGTQNVTINFGTTDGNFRVLCIPYSGNPGTDNAPDQSACYAKIATYGSIAIATPSCTAPTLTARANGTATSINICNGDEVDLTSNPSGGADCSGSWDYEWSTTDATQNVDDLTPAANVTYRVTVSCSDDAACSNTSQVIVAVNDVPTISTQPIDTTICDGQNTRFIMATSGATSHKWQVDDGGGFVDIANGGVYSNATTTTLNITGAGTAMSSYLYRGVATNGCGSVNTSSRELTVNAVPAAPAGDDKSICEGGVVPDLEATGTAIEWYSDAGLTTNVESGVTFATGETDPGTYTFYATQTIDGCESPANTIELEIVAKPAAPTGTDDVACIPATEVTVEATSGLDTIKWYDDPTAGSLLHTGGTYTDNIVATTSYYADATNAEGCVSDRTEVQGIITTTDTTTLMSASGISETEFTALWHSKPLALNYWLDVSTDSTFSTFLAGYNNRDMDLDTTITISGLTPGVRYHYRVRVENVCGLGINIANVISVSTPLTPCRTYRKCIWEGDVSTDWNTAANWKCDSIPTAYDTVLIPTLPANFNPVIGVAPNPTTDGICNNITIETGEVLTINTGRELVVKGDWTNNGSAELGEGEVVFSKGSTQYIRGANNWANIEFANDVIMVAATGAQNLKGVMKKTAGTLTTNNQLTLLSVSTPAPYGRTACIDGGIGSVAGDVTVQRYLFPPGGTNIGYKYLSVPTSNATVAQFSSDDITVKSTYWNADYSQLKWSNFWYYNEVNTAQVLHPDPVITDINQQIMQNGWIAPSGPADPMPPMRGYALYIDCNKAIDVVGPLNDGEQTFTLSYTNSTVVGAPTATSNHDGWNFIGNPYPCPIDYSVEAGWDKTNVLPPVYFFKPTTLYYGVDYMWVPIGGGYGVSIPEGLSPVIGSMQSFFVKTENEAKHGSTFTVNNLARTPVTDANCYKKSNAIYPYQLRLQIENRITKRDDQTLIYFAKGATIGYDPKMEAFKMISEDPDMPFIYSKVRNFATNETHYLAINALPYPKEDIEIPLTIALREANTYIIKPMQMPAFVAGETVWLEDRIDGKMQNLSENPAYIINLPKGTHSNRFFIHIKKATKPCINPETQFVTNIQGSTVRLNWSSVETAEQYLIRWRAKTPGAPWRYYNATPSQNAVTIGHLAPQSTYEWQMRTLCFGELSYATTFTELQEFKTKVDCKDIVVRGRQVTDITTSKAVIKYYTEPLATHYMIRFREKNTADWKYLNVAGDVGAVQIGCEVCDPIHKLKTATTYEWQMRAFCKVDNSVYSAFSTILEFTTLDNKKKYNPENSIINKVADNVTLNVFPNPYKGETNIKYTLQTKAKIKIEVYNMFGVIVAVIEDKILEAGAYNAKFSAKDIGLSAGIYTIKLQTPDYTVERKIVEIE